MRLLHDLLGSVSASSRGRFNFADSISAADMRERESFIAATKYSKSCFPFFTSVEPGCIKREQALFIKG